MFSKLLGIRDSCIKDIWYMRKHVSFAAIVFLISSSPLLLLGNDGDSNFFAYIVFTPIWLILVCIFWFWSIVQYGKELKVMNTKTLTKDKLYIFFSWVSIPILFYMIFIFFLYLLFIYREGESYIYVFYDNLITLIQLYCLILFYFGSIFLIALFGWVISSKLNTNK